MDSPEIPMSDNRLKEIKKLGNCHLEGDADVELAECVAEIERLRAALRERDSDVAGYFKIRDGHLKQIAELEAALASYKP